MAYLAMAIIIVGIIFKNYNDQKIIDTKIVPNPMVNHVLDIDPDAIVNDISTTTPKKEVKIIPKPLISAEAYLVGNLETGEIYAYHNPTSVFPIASLSKLISTIVTIHNTDPDKKIVITQSMLDSYGDAGHLVLDETLTTSELLYPLLLESSNDAAEALAQDYGYDAFIQKMNEFVSSINMKSTSFKDPSGLSSSNISNARDLLTLASYIYKNEKTILDISRTIQKTLATTTDHGGHIWDTINPFSYDPNFIGGKTGRTTEAKESMVSIFDYISGEEEYPIAIIVLRSNWSTREVDTSILFEKAVTKLDKK